MERDLLNSFQLQERKLLVNTEDFMKWCNLVRNVFNPLRIAMGLPTIEVSPQNWRREEPDQPSVP